MTCTITVKAQQQVQYYGLVQSREECISNYRTTRLTVKRGIESTIVLYSEPEAESAINFAAFPHTTKERLASPVMRKRVKQRPLLAIVDSLGTTNDA